MTSSLFLYAVLALVQILFGINFVVSKIIVTSLPPELWAFIRFFVSSLLLMGVLVAVRRPRVALTRKDMVVAILLAFIGMTVGQTLLLKGIRLSTATHAAILSSTIPLFTMLIVWIKKEEPITQKKMIGLMIALVGILIIQKVETLSFSSGSWVGDGLILLSCLGVGAYMAFGKTFVSRIRPLWATTIFFFFAAIQIFPLAYPHFHTLGAIHDSPRLLWAMGYSIIAATIVTYVLSNWVLSKLPAGPVALFTYLQPITASIVAVLVLGEAVTGRTMIGASLVFVGLFLAISKRRNQKNEAMGKPSDRPQSDAF